MSQFNFIRRCHSCGAILQGEDAEKPGYIDPEVLGNLSAKVLFCNHCFAESKYNIAPRSPSADEDIALMLHDAEASDALIVYVVDLFSFENSFIPELTDIISGLPLLVLANKRDLLPSTASDDELCEYVAHRCRVASLACKAEDVMLVSLASDSDVSGIWEKIHQKRQGHDVYVIGASLAGKTQLVSSLLHNYSNPTEEAVASVVYPGTSSQVMQIPLDSSAYLYEIPGTSLDNNVISKLNAHGRAQIIPTKAVEATEMHLFPEQGFFLGALARVELLEGPKTEVNIYVSSKVDVVKTYGGDNEVKFFRRIDRGNLVPVAEKGTAPSDFDAFDIVVSEEGSRDIGIAGLGWFSFTGAKQKWRIYVLKGVGLYASRAKVKIHAHKAK
ncbi:MAG: hypothetical protein IJU64_06775 [Bacilli bacterium]|nr:hypothetical protein [Bacilli bacterium]